MSPEQLQCLSKRMEQLLRRFKLVTLARIALVVMAALTTLLRPIDWVPVLKRRSYRAGSSRA